MKWTHFFLLTACLAMISCGGGKGPEDTAKISGAFGLMASEGRLSVDLNWLPIDDASHYRVYWDTAEGVQTDDMFIDVDTQTRYQHSGLLNNQNYYYRIAAIRDNGEEVLSNEAEVYVSSLHLAYSATQQYDFSEIEFDGEFLFASDRHGNVYRSLDGSQWDTVGFSLTNNNVNSLKWSGTKLYLVTYKNVLSSTDGHEWISHAIETREDDQELYTDIEFDGNRSVISDANRGMLVSDDERIWRVYDDAAGASPWVLRRDNNRYMMVGHRGNVGFSRDGKTWSVYSTGTDSFLYDIAWTGSQYVATGIIPDFSQGTSVLVTSPDGRTWTRQPVVTSGNLTAIAWNGVDIVVVGNSISLTSQDGVNWNPQPLNYFTVEDVLWKDSEFVAVTNSGAALTSPDGNAWTLKNEDSFSNNHLYGAAYNGDRYIVVGKNGLVLSSDDGETWVRGSTDITTLTNMDVTWTGTQFVIVGYGGRVFTSPDGSTWTRHSVSSSHYLNGVVWTGTQLVAVGQNGSIVTSPDGINWTSRTLATSRDFITVIWTGSELVAVGSERLYASSPDGINWTIHNNIPSPSELNEINDVVWTGNEYVIVGENIHATSPDGINWTETFSDYSSSPSMISLTWTGTQFIGVSYGGRIHTSEDGRNWRLNYSGMDTLTKIINVQDRIIITGFYERILTGYSR